MDKSSIFPGYFIEKPLFQAEKKFRRLLSEQDSCFHLNQVSLLFLEDYIKDEGLHNETFIKSLGEKYSISSGHKNWDLAKKKMARSYIVQTYNIQEIFFKSFNKEYKTYKKITNWKTKIKVGKTDKKIDPYTQLIKNMPKNDSAIFENKPESQIIQYYRLIRNGIVHKSEKSMVKPMDYFENTIKPHESYFKNYFKFLPEGKLPAPNDPNNLNHNDFFIYSRCLKNLINLIINAGNLTIEEIFDFEINNPSFLKTMKKHNSTTEKSTNKMIDAVSMFFRTKYGNIEKEKAEFIDTYLLWRRENYS